MKKTIQIDQTTKRIINIGLAPEDGFVQNESGFFVNSFPDGQWNDYLYKDGEYIYDPIVYTPTAEEIEQAKTTKISTTKTELADYLSSHPLQWTDGNYYSVTEEKQSLLTSNLALYSIAAAASIDFQLTWNTTGEECTSWTYEDLSALALAIGAYVKPFVSRQQELEVAIKACTTLDEINAIEISYDLNLTTSED